MDSLTEAMRSLADRQIVEFHFRSNAGTLLISLFDKKTAAEGVRRSLPVEKDEGQVPGFGSAGDPPRPSKAAWKARFILMRSPEVGTWSAAIASEDLSDVLEESAVLGHIRTLVSDEPLHAPCRGRVKKWLVAEGEAVGLGTPLAYWEVI
jgi:biotin carboxyl carrier protein